MTDIINLMQSIDAGADPLLTQSQVVELYGGSPVTWARRRVRGDGPRFVKLGSRKQSSVRYRKSDIDAWIAAQVRRSTSDTGSAAA